MNYLVWYSGSIIVRVLGMSYPCLFDGNRQKTCSVCLEISTYDFQQFLAQIFYKIRFIGCILISQNLCLSVNLFVRIKLTFIWTCLHCLTKIHFVYHCLGEKIIFKSFSPGKQTCVHWKNVYFPLIFLGFFWLFLQLGKPAILTTWITGYMDFFQFFIFLSKFLKIIF